MKKQSQEQQILSMMKDPAPKKRVGIVKLKMIRESSVLYGTQRFSSAKEAVKMVYPLFRYSDREMMVVMSLDIALTPIAMEIAAVGGLISCSIHARDIFKHAVLCNAARIICFHNHPSGNLSVSKADSAITAQIKEAGTLLGIELVDHIIVGLEEEFISFRENGIFPFSNGEGAA